MLPFPRLINLGTVLEPNVLMDIDFSTRAIGANTIVDKKGHQFSTLSGSGAEIVYDSTINSNVMYFKGTEIFSTPMIDDLKLSNIEFDIHCVFKSLSTTGIQTIFETGYYPPSGSVRGGISLNLNQYTAQYIQLFVCVSNTNYNRVLLSGTNTSDYEDITIQVRSTGISIFNARTSQLNTYSRFSFGDGIAFSIGGSYVGLPGTPYYFNGYLKSLKITKKV